MAARRSADAVTSEPADGQESPSAASRLSTRVRSSLLMVMLVVLVAGLVAVVLLGREVRADTQEDENRLQALDTARQFTVNFTTLDYREPDKSIEAVKSLAAGKFRKEYIKSEPATKNLVKSFQTVSKPTIHDAGIVEFDQDSARVIVISDANQTDAKNSKPQPKTYRLQLDLRQVGGNWRIVDVRYL